MLGSYFPDWDYKVKIILRKNHYCLHFFLRGLNFMIIEFTALIFFILCFYNFDSFLIHERAGPHAWVSAVKVSISP